MDSDEKRPLTAGQLAGRAGVNIQTIRFYDRNDILKPTGRSEAGYRMYDESCVKQLNFILQAKELGFSLSEIKELLNLRIKSAGACDRVRKKAGEKLSEVREKIRHLKNLEKTLAKLVADCENRILSEECPILSRMDR